MTRSVVPLRLTDPGHEAHLALPCAGCQLLLVEPVILARARDSEMFDVKHRWFHDVSDDWGTCALLLKVNDQVVGHVLYAPHQWVPGAQALPTSPPSQDAVLLVHLWVHPEHRGVGLGKLLVHAVAKDLLRREIDGGIEVFADATGSRDAPLVPEGFCSAVGFGVQRAHPTTPRMRMDLRATRTWLTDLESALERLVEAVRPKNEPATGHPVAGRVAQPRNAESSLSIAALGLAPTMDLTTSPPK